MGYIYWLVVSTPLKNIWKSVGIIIPNMMESHNPVMFQTTNRLSIFGWTKQLKYVSIDSPPWWRSNSARYWALLWGKATEIVLQVYYVSTVCSLDIIWITSSFYVHGASYQHDIWFFDGTRRAFIGYPRIIPTWIRWFDTSVISNSNAHSHGGQSRHSKIAALLVALCGRKKRTKPNAHCVFDWHLIVFHNFVDFLLRPVNFPRDILP